MPKNPLRHQPQQSPGPLVHHTVWLQLPAGQRRECHELITQLLIAVIHSEQHKEHPHERQD